MKFDEFKKQSITNRWQNESFKTQPKYSVGSINDNQRVVMEGHS